MMRLYFKFVVVLFVCSLLITGCIIIGNKTDFSSLFQEKINEVLVAGNERSKNIIYVVPLSGVIVSKETSTSLLSAKNISPLGVSILLDFLSKKENLKGIVLEINSPGGSASASEEIYQAILDFKNKTQIPVVTYFNEIAASGGYYIAQASDIMIANPQALVGSIGVISMFFSAQGLIEKKLEIKPVVVKSGKFKDTGSMFREMSSEEVAYWQNIVMQSYEQFVDVVSKGRRLSRDETLKVADGRVFTASDALKYKLIDKIGSLKEAILQASSKASLGNDYKALKLIKGSNLSQISLSSSYGGVFEHNVIQHVDTILSLKGQILYLSNYF